MPEHKPPHDSSDELPEDDLPEGDADSVDLPEDFADDGDEIVTPLSAEAMAAMLSASVDENGEKKRCEIGRAHV